MSVNVNRNLKDDFYRYKMPKIIAKVEGKGNGIKTVIVNMVEVAKALNRPPMYPTKFFGCILGAQTNFDKNERYIVNGSHNSAKLQDILDGFIQKYVLCPNCKNPETDLHVSTKRVQISTTCKACGNFSVLTHRDKLTAYIMKCPPENNSSGSGGSNNKESKKTRSKNKDDKKKNDQEGDSDEIADDSGIKEDNCVNEDDWCEDTGEDAVAKRMSLLTSGVNRLMANTDLEKSSEERLQIFFEYVKKQLDANPNGLDVDIGKEIVAEAERLDIRDKSVFVLCELLFNENMVSQIKTYRNLLIRFCANNPKAQKYLLRGFELTIKEYQNVLLPKVARILTIFYDLDILEEKVILDWSQKVHKKTVGKELTLQIHQKAEPFLKWLKEADEEESDEEEDNDLAVVYDDRVRGDKIHVEKDEPNKKDQHKKQEQETKKKDDDIDIDAI